MSHVALGYWHQSSLLTGLHKSLSSGSVMDGECVLAFVAVQHSRSQHRNRLVGGGHSQSLDVGVHPSAERFLWILLWRHRILLVRIAFSLSEMQALSCQHPALAAACIAGVCGKVRSALTKTQTNSLAVAQKIISHAGNAYAQTAISDQPSQLEVAATGGQARGPWPKVASMYRKDSCAAPRVLGPAEKSQHTGV